MTYNDGLRDRIQWVLANRPLTANSWSLAANRARTHVSGLLARISAADDAGRDIDVAAATLIDLARAANVDPSWFVVGDGTADGSGTSTGTHIDAFVAEIASETRAWARDVTNPWEGLRDLPREPALHALRGAWRDSGGRLASVTKVQPQAKSAIIRRHAG